MIYRSLLSLSFVASRSSRKFPINVERPVLSRRQVLVAGLFGSCATSFLFCLSDEGLKRAIIFNWEVLPIALHYKATELYSRLFGKNCTQQLFAPLHVRYAPVCLDIVLRQKGFYVKTAQFLSQYPDVLPQEYTDAFKILRDEAPAMPYNFVKEIVSKELGRPLEDVFAIFSEHPIGAASIGQVHAAQLLDGTEVVVKVQYPRAEWEFNVDVDLSIKLAGALAPYYVDILRQMKKTFTNEFDYRREAALQREAQDRLKDLTDVVVPSPLDQKYFDAKGFSPQVLITKHVFTMERLYGQSVDRWAFDRLQEVAKRNGETPESVLQRLRSLSEAEIQKLIPSKRSMQVYRTSVAAQNYCLKALTASYNWTFGHIWSPINFVGRRVPINVHEVVDRLFQVQGLCIFREGFFNSDPHAGNVLLLDDGRVGLIDWGQVCELSEAKRIQFAKSIIAVADRDEPLVAKLSWEMGVRTVKGSDWALMKLGMFWLGNFGDEVCGELGGAASFEQNLSRVDPLETVGEDFFAAVRCLLLTRGAVALMGFPCEDSAKRLRGAAIQLLNQKGCKFQTRPGTTLLRPDLEAIFGVG